MNENEMIEVQNLEAATDVEELESPENPQMDEISLLRAEIDALRLELSKREELDRANSRMNAELAEFTDYFPEIDINSIPDEVWEKVKKGYSLAATYALFSRKSEREKKKIGDFNEKNRRMSAGSLMRGEGEKYYSPAEVRRMSPAQVKSHYDDIIASMKHWN